MAVCFGVGLLTNRSLEMMIGIYGILKAGGAYVPIDPNYPSDRINYILGDSQPSVLLTDQAHRVFSQINNFIIKFN